MRALLVEADPATAEPLRRVLHARGWDVRPAEGGAGAREALAEGPFALVVLAPHLAPDDRLDACRAVRGSVSGQAAFLLVALVDAGPEALRQLSAAGADDFLLWPCSDTELCGRLVVAECRLHVSAGVAFSPGVAIHQARDGDLHEMLLVQWAALEELFQSAPEGIAVVDELDHVVRINSEFSRMFGYAPEEALGYPIDELIVPDHLREEGRSLARSTARGERTALETVRRRKDGTLIDVTVLATPIRVAGGGPIGGYAIYRDITQRKEHERALSESETRYRALFDQSPVGVFLCDPELRVTHCNEQLARIIGSRPEQIVGTDLRALPDNRIFSAVRQAFEGDATVYEGPYQPPDGRDELWVCVRYALLRDGEGRVIGGMGVVEDVTERERAQAQLRERTLELEAAMQSRARLYTAMNHELRTPISAIMLHQELLLSGTFGELRPEQAEAVEHAQSAAKHLLDLVRDVLDLSKLEAGRVRVQPVVVPLDSLLLDLRATALPLAQRYGSELHLEIQPDLPPTVTDPRRVRQILLNLLGNAAKFGRGQPIVVRSFATDGDITIEVVDRGIGMAAEDLPHIFEEFVQVGGAHEGGTGLGLAISRRLASLLGGRIEVESELGVGSTFRLILPAAVGGQKLATLRDA